ncbi:MAG TPA: chloride channel protein [Kofleriaceae bacterium]|nr:chloride channel protein [Kofleriaceae bacterium]
MLLVPTERQRLFGLTIAIGGACGVAAVWFHLSIQYLETRTIERALSADDYGWIYWTLIVPTLGGLLSGLLLYYVVPNARGSGIPQVKVAYAAKGGRLRVRDSVGKFVIGTLQIGTGSSLGREGPTVQICAGVASGLARLAGISQRNARRLIPVGAAAGIAAAFNAPIAAVTFTIEEVVGTLDQTLLSGVIVAAALAAVVERSVLGRHPVFSLQHTADQFGVDSAQSLLLYAALGIAAAFVSIAFTEGLLGLRKYFRDVARLPKWAQPAAGALLTGGLAVAALGWLHSRGVTGGGYDTARAALDGEVAVKVALALCGMKLVATVCSYASGGAGGIFAPSLFIGGMLGVGFGSADVWMFGDSHAAVGSFALVGMGAVFAGIIRAPITSVLIIIEMTNGYSLILPLMIANMTAYGLARRLRPTPIYEALLEQDGIKLAQHAAAPDGLDAMSLEEFAGVNHDFVSFFPSLTGAKLVKDSEAADRQEVFPVLDADERLVGIITLEDLALLAAEPDLQNGLVTAVDVMRPPIAIVETETVRAAFDLLVSHDLRELPVIDDEQRVVGMIDEVALAHAYMRARQPRTGGAPRSSDSQILPDDIQ